MYRVARTSLVFAVLLAGSYACTTEDDPVETSTTATTNTTEGSGGSGGSTTSANGGGTTSSTGGSSQGGGAQGGGGGAVEPPTAACDGVTDFEMGTAACVSIAGDAECNPISNEGCEAGTTCDALDVDTYQCFAPDVNNCGEACNNEDTFCNNGLTCTQKAAFSGKIAVPTTCGRWCCVGSDADCGPNGICVSIEHTLNPGLGICMTGPLAE